MSIPTIEIDLDLPCPECGKPGATQGGKGRCLECAAKFASRRRSMSKLGDKTISSIVNQVRELLDCHDVELNEAYQKHGEDKFAISIKAIIEPSGSANKIETTISFRPEPDKKDSTDGIVDEDQMDLEFGEPDEN
jgi:hypothetical protein